MVYATALSLTLMIQLGSKIKDLHGFQFWVKARYIGSLLGKIFLALMEVL